METTPVEYRDIPDFPGYRVGNDGSVWSNKGWRGTGGSWKRLSPGGDKYLGVSLRTANRLQRLLIHRVVLAAFVGPCPVGMECCHRDGNGKNNRLENLRWGTRKSNAEERVMHGTQARGEKVGTSKLKEDQVLRIIKRKGETAKIVAADFGVSASIVVQIWSGERWAHLQKAVIGD